MQMENNMIDRQLFSQQHFHEAAQQRREQTVMAIQAFDMAKTIATPLDELSQYFISRFTMNAPRLKPDKIYLLDIPKEISAAEQMSDRWSGEYVNINRTYIQFTVCIPFEGDASLFDLRPTSLQINYSRKLDASIKNNEIYLRYREPTDGRQLEPNSLYENDVRLIEINAQRLATDIANFNRDLPDLIIRNLNERKKSAEKNQSIIQSFKIPIKKREDIPTTYSIPEIQRKPRIMETSKIKTFKPEPTLAPEEYENILSIIKDMALAMERSPSTFIKLKEEEIRDFFLILLNGHYQGSATGETFNGVGKTDILIRHHNANAFIAECKFWRGQTKLTEAIDQLLGYVTWRDTKTSILLFNKNSDLSSVIKKADETIKKHKNYKSEFCLTSGELSNTETILGYKLTHPSDEDKEIFLTLMAYQINKPHG